MAWSYYSDIAFGKTLGDVEPPLIAFATIRLIIPTEEVVEKICHDDGWQLTDFIVSEADRDWSMAIACVKLM